MRVTEFRGNYWQCQPDRRFWYPVGRIEALPPEQIGRPALVSSGYRANVRSRAQGNALIPMTLVEDLPGYGAHRVARNERADLRRALRDNQYIRLSDPSVLAEQGWPVAREAAIRHGHWDHRDRRSFERTFTVRLERDSYWVLAGFRDGRLGGWFAAHALGETLYVDEICLGEAGRGWRVGLGLYWLTLRTAAAVPGIRRAWLGAWYPTLPSIVTFKRRFGASTVALPAIARVNPLLREVARRRSQTMYANLGCSRDLAGIDLDPADVPTAQ